MNSQSFPRGCCDKAGSLRRQRISFILSSLWLSGGVRVIVEFANRLAQRGYRIALVAPGGTIDADIATELLPAVHVRESPVRRRSQMSAWQNLRLAWSLAASTPPSDLIFSTHTPTTVAGWLAAQVQRKGKLAWLYQDYREQFEGRPLERWLMRHALRWHEVALTVSDYSKCELEGYTKGEVIVVGEGLSHADLFRPLSDDARPADKEAKTILFLGDTRPRKGLYDLLEATSIVHKKLPDIRLVIASKQQYEIESAVPVEFLYRPTRAQLAQRYATCDLFVSASWRESFGLPPLEAMACGAPVVLTDSGGAREYARHGENCWMVPPRSPRALAEGMLRVLTDEELSDHLRRNGPPTAARFTWERAVDRFEQALCHMGPRGQEKGKSRA